MSKITVTTIAGLTSGGDANKVKIESGDDFIVDTDALVVDASTNRVGIGTTSPSNQLHVTGSGADTQARVETTSAGHASRLLLHANNYSGGSYNAIQSFQGDAGAAWEISGAKANFMYFCINFEAKTDEKQSFFNCVFALLHALSENPANLENRCFT